MGLLSDPDTGSAKWVGWVRKLHSPLGFLCYILAIAWFVMLGHKAFNNETYFSENALLPGLVTNEFNADKAAIKYLSDFLVELEDKYSDTDEMPVSWLVAKMSQVGLEVHTHNFTLNYPFGHGQTFKGTNVYGILRAARTPSLEAIVVSAPYRPLSSHQKGTAAGIALMLAFAEFAKPQKYWAKDIIFLVTEHEQLGMQAWLEAYHGIKSSKETFYTSLGSFWPAEKQGFDIGSFLLALGTQSEKCLNPGTLKGRSGSIQAAINLEFHTQKIKYVEVKIEGLNGQLPNLDFPNLVHKLLVKAGIYHSFKNHFSWIRNKDKMDEWKANFQTMMGMLVTQIAGVPNGNHGLFHRFGIEAVTLEGRDASDPAGSPPKTASLSSATFYRLGVALESILRSLNNLLERFHQSFFFYLMAAINRFASIGQYMPSLSLLCGAMLIRALGLWVSILHNQDEEKSKKKTGKEKKDSQTKDDESEKHISTKIIPENVMKSMESSISIVNVGINFLIVHFLGYAVMNAPILMSYIGSHYFNIASEYSVYYGLVTLSVILAFIIPFMGPKTYLDLVLTNVIILLELATICLCVGMHNFSLGMCLAVFYTPLALTVSIAKNSDGRFKKFKQCLKLLTCLILHPLSILTVSLVVTSLRLFPEEGTMAALARGRDAAAQAVMFANVDSLIYGNWLFNVISIFVLPTWLIFWQLLFKRVTV